MLSNYGEIDVMISNFVHESLTCAPMIHHSDITEKYVREIDR